MPRYARKTIDTNEQKIGQPGVVTMPATGAAVLEHSELEVPDGPVTKDFAAALAFNLEPITVMVHTTSDKNAEKVVPVWINGRYQGFPRGLKVTCPRMFVERLALCKITNFQNQEFRDADGVMGTRYPRSDSLAYPFSVIEDSNPNGGPWLQKLLAMPS